MGQVASTQGNNEHILSLVLNLCNSGVQEDRFTFTWEQQNMKIELPSNGANVDKKNYENRVLYEYIQ